MMDWDSPISKDSNTIKDGDYPYLIVDAEKKFTRSTLKPMLEVRVKITLDTGYERELRDWIVLSEETEWKVGQFLVSIGQKERGKMCVPDWSDNAIIGRHGFLRVKNRNDRTQITWLAPKKTTTQQENEENEEAVSQQPEKKDEQKASQDDFFAGFTPYENDSRVPF